MLSLSASFLLHIFLNWTWWFTFHVQLIGWQTAADKPGENSKRELQVWPLLSLLTFADCPWYRLLLRPPSFSPSKFSQLLNCLGNFPILLHLRGTRDLHTNRHTKTSPWLVVKQQGNLPWCHHAPEYFSTDKREKSSVLMLTLLFLLPHIQLMLLLSTFCSFTAVSWCTRISTLGFHLHPIPGRSQVSRTVTTWFCGREGWMYRGKSSPWAMFRTFNHFQLEKPSCLCATKQLFMNTPPPPPLPSH